MQTTTQTTTTKHPGRKVKTRPKARLSNANHNETLVRVPKPALGLKVKTHVKAGALIANHNETLVRL
jgi:hypothetical protein